MAKVIYEGFFLFNLKHECVGENILSALNYGLGYHLDKPIEKLHVTTAFKPETPKKHLYGHVVRIYLGGYQCSDTNEALLVELVRDEYDLLPFYDFHHLLEFDDLIDELDTPHITISVSKDGKPKDSKYLDFKQMDLAKNFCIYTYGVFGAYLDDGRYIFSDKEVDSYEN